MPSGGELFQQRPADASRPTAGAPFAPLHPHLVLARRAGDNFDLCIRAGRDDGLFGRRRSHNSCATALRRAAGGSRKMQSWRRADSHFIREPIARACSKPAPGGLRPRTSAAIAAVSARARARRRDVRLDRGGILAHGGLGRQPTVSQDPPDRGAATPARAGERAQSARGDRRRGDEERSPPGAGFEKALAIGSR